MTIRVLLRIGILSILLFLFPTLSFGSTEVILYLSDVNWDLDQHPKIHLMRPQGTDHRIVTTDYPVASASLNPDGNWITYVSKARKEVRKVHVSGKREKVLVRLRHSSGPKGPTDVKVSPNGRYVAYTRYYPYNGPGNKIGLEVYDTRLRKFSTTTQLGPEVSGPNRREIIVRRLLWSPDSKTLAASVDYTKQALGNSGWYGERFTLIYDRKTGQRLRRLNSLATSDREPLEFYSNTKLLAFGNDSRGGLHKKNALYEYDFVRNTTVRLFNTTDDSMIKGLALNPGRRFISMDIGHLTTVNGAIGFQPWSSVSGTPRVADRPWYRTFATLNLSSLAAQFTSPLSDSAGGMDQFDINNLKSLYSPSFEWRRVRSAAAFKGSTCWGWRVTIFGTPGNDRITGTAGADVIAAGSGNDTVKSLGGNDIICAGDGNDVVDAGPGTDTVYGDIDVNQNNVSDIIYSGDDRLFGSTGDDSISGLGGADFIRGDAGNDFLYGGTDNDRISGGAGDDYLQGQEGDDILTGGRGDDINNGGDGTDRCAGALQTSECE